MKTGCSGKDSFEWKLQRVSVVRILRLQGRRLVLRDFCIAVSAWNLHEVPELPELPEPCEDVVTAEALHCRWRSTRPVT